MACPHVAGVLALGKALDPSATPQELRDCAIATADDVDDLKVIDARRFLEDCVAHLSPTPQPNPTTYHPTPEPTTSKAPTLDCVCDQTLELDLYTDRYPQETTWSLEMLDPSDRCVLSEESGGPPVEKSMLLTYVLSSKICAGERYRFTLFDDHGDGLCCTFGSGWFRLRLENVVIADGDVFAFFTERTSAKIKLECVRS